MNTNLLIIAENSFDLMTLGAVIIGVAVALGIAGMIVNGILIARRVKKADQAKTELVEAALHASDKKAEEPSKKEGPGSSGDEAGDSD